MEQQFYYLKVSSNNCKVQCLLNGFPVYHIDSEGQIFNQVPVNLALVGLNNRLRVKMQPLGDNATVKGSISLYREGEMVSTYNKREPTVSFLLDASKVQEEVYIFDNEFFDFSEVLKEATPIYDRTGLIDYAMKLKALVEQRDVKNLLEQMEYKIKDCAVAYSIAPDTLRESVEESFTEGMFDVAWEEVGKDDIVPVPYCNGRLWELTTSEGNPLFFSKNESGSSSFPVYVVQIEGELCVVR